MGLYDREYMRQTPASAPAGSGRQAMFTLIIVNVVCFLLAYPGSRLYYQLALTVNGELGGMTLLQLFTAGFLHGGFWHLVFNMWGLYLFGSLIAPHLSGTKFVLTYMSGVLAGNLLFLLFNLQTPSMLVGASGAVCAIMAAAATLEPERRFVMIFMPFMPLKTTTMVICYTIMDLLFVGSDDGVAHLAHLGGFLGGYVLMRICFGRNLPWDPLRKLLPVNRGGRPVPPPFGKRAGGASGRVSQAELDALLDKLSTEGVNSLSEYELERLRQARRQMRGEE